MATPTQDQSVRPLTDMLLACLTTEIAKIATPPASVCLRTGTQVDLLVSLTQNECCNGLAWVRPGDVYYTETFPDPLTGAANRCNSLRLAVPLEMGVARCAPTPDAGIIPTCDEWTDLTYAILDDQAAMRRALCCFILMGENQGRLYAPGSFQQLTNDGGCAGSTFTVIFATDNCDC